MIGHPLKSSFTTAKLRNKSCFRTPNPWLLARLAAGLSEITCARKVVPTSLFIDVAQPVNKPSLDRRCLQTQSTVASGKISTPPHDAVRRDHMVGDQSPVSFPVMILGPWHHAHLISLPDSVLTKSSKHGAQHSPRVSSDLRAFVEPPPRTSAGMNTT